VSDEDNRGEQNGLHEARHDQRDLSTTMAVQRMCHVEKRGPAWRARIHHVKQSLELAIQIDKGLRETLEDQLIVAVVPPPMELAFRKSYFAACPSLDFAATYDGGNRT
jgi:hypothetical protein